MNLFKNIFYFFYTFFEILSFKTKPKYEAVNDDEEYEFINLNEKMNR